MSLNAPLSIEETKQVINNLENNKSPGEDGFSVEYYKALGGKSLPPHLTSVFNKAPSSGSFPQEMLKAIVITLPKPGKEPTHPKNLRPTVYPFLIRT